MSLEKKILIEIITTGKHTLKRRYRYVTRTDGPGYCRLVAEWNGSVWQTVAREYVADIQVDKIEDLSTESSSTSLVECPVCGRVGLPERIVNHDCQTGLTH